MHHNHAQEKKKCGKEQCFLSSALELTDFCLRFFGQTVETPSYIFKALRWYEKEGQKVPRDGQRGDTATGKGKAWPSPSHLKCNNPVMFATSHLDRQTEVSPP